MKTNIILYFLLVFYCIDYTVFLFLFLLNQNTFIFTPFLTLEKKNTGGQLIRMQVKIHLK